MVDNTTRRFARQTRTIATGAGSVVDRCGIGYIRHPQLARFRVLDDPLAGIGSYLRGLADEAARRGYHFDVTRIVRSDRALTLTVTRGQLDVEASHLLAKLKERSPDRVPGFPAFVDLRAHPLFTVVPGPVADWERARP